MSLFSTMNTATSGLGASSTRLGVIGNNIANLNTTAYKSARAEFSDMLPQDVYGQSGPSQLGKGTQLSTLTILFGQGSIDASENALDMAISGEGFFVVNDGVANYYTRAGEFYLDDAGYIVNSTGLVLQGYSATDGTLGATVGDLQVDLNPLAPVATSEITLTANLSAESDYATTPVAALNLTTGTGDTLEDAADAGDFATSVTVYDSLGVPHAVTVVYERTAANDWSWYAVVDAGEVDITSLGGPGTPGAAFQIASGTLTFDTDGNLTTFTQTDTSGVDPWAFEAATAQDFVFDFGVDTTGAITDGRVRMHNGASNVSAVSQDGYPVGSLQNISVDTDGTVYGSYTNGEELILGQVVLARFPSNGGLERTGGNLFRETLDSGSPAIGAPDTGGRGVVQGGALERSNVDLEDEFVDMITAQRSYQANARVIDTANQTLQELVNLV